VISFIFLVFFQLFFVFSTALKDSVWLVLEVIVLLIWLAWSFDYWRSPRKRHLDQMFLASLRVRNAELHAALTAIADEIARSYLTAVPQRAVAQTIAKTGIHDSALTIFRNSPSILAGISFLGRVADEEAGPILEFCLRYKNVYSAEALESLAQRAMYFPQERQHIANAALTVYADPDLNWKFVKKAEKCLIAARSAPSRRISRLAWLKGQGGKVLIGRILVSVVIAILCIGLLGTTNILISRQVKRSIQSVTPSELEPPELEPGLPFRPPMQLDPAKRIAEYMTYVWFFAICAAGVFLYFAVKKASKGAEKARPLAWALSGIVFYFSVPLFYFCRDEMRRNAIPFDWAALEVYLQQLSN